MGLQACADKLNNELEEFGNPPRFPSDEAMPDAAVRPTSNLITAHVSLRCFNPAKCTRAAV